MTALNSAHRPCPLRRAGSLLLLLAALAGPAPPAGAAAAACPTPVAGAASPAEQPVLEAGLGLGRFFTGVGSRSRVVQVCVVVMCLALFILMKKWAP